MLRHFSLLPFPMLSFRDKVTSTLAIGEKECATISGFVEDKETAYYWVKVIFFLNKHSTQQIPYGPKTTAYADIPHKPFLCKNEDGKLSFPLNIFNKDVEDTKTINVKIIGHVRYNDQHHLWYFPGGSYRSSPVQEIQILWRCQGNSHCCDCPSRQVSNFEVFVAIETANQNFFFFLK